MLIFILYNAIASMKHNIQGISYKYKIHGTSDKHKIKKISDIYH